MHPTFSIYTWLRRSTNSGTLNYRNVPQSGELLVIIAVGGISVQPRSFLEMGCGGSSAAKAEPLPNGAPADWKDAPTATFKLLDKTGTGTIVLVSYKMRETTFSEISAMGDDVMELQKAIGDFASAPIVLMEDWIDLIKGRIEDKGWEEVSKFLTAVDAAVADTKRNVCETTAKAVFKLADEGWAEPPNTGTGLHPTCTFTTMSVFKSANVVR